MIEVDMVEVIDQKNLPEGELVYFIRPVEGGLVKIGRTNDLKKRLMILQVGSPVILEVAYVVLSGRVDATESKLHTALRQYRRHGEWFDSLCLVALGVAERPPSSRITTSGLSNYGYWTLEQEQVLIDNHDRSSRHLASLTGRSLGAVKSRMSKLRARGLVPELTHGSSVRRY